MLKFKTLLFSMIGMCYFFPVQAYEPINNHKIIADSHINRVINDIDLHESGALNIDIYHDGHETHSLSVIDNVGIITDTRNNTIAAISAINTAGNYIRGDRTHSISIYVEQRVRNSSSSSIISNVVIAINILDISGDTNGNTPNNNCNGNSCSIVGNGISALSAANSSINKYLRND